MKHMLKVNENLRNLYQWRIIIIGILLIFETGINPIAI
jgi:hypothetical protein